VRANAGFDFYAQAACALVYGGCDAAPMPLDNTRSPGTPLDTQYASARRLRYMLPVQIKWMINIPRVHELYALALILS
jgi:hypothetical protein